MSDFIEFMDQNFKKPTDEELGNMTDQDLSDILERIGVEVIDKIDTFTAVNHKVGGGEMELEADNLTDALREAWNIFKPV